MNYIIKLYHIKVDSPLNEKEIKKLIKLFGIMN